MPGKNWLIEGKYVEYCSCDLGCPCESMADPTYGHCTGLVGFKIDKGHCDDVRPDDLKVIATFYFPRAIHHGQGVMHPIIDERASEAQKRCVVLYPIRRGSAGRHHVPDLLGDRRDHQGPAVRTDHFDWDLEKRQARIEVAGVVARA